MSTNSKKCGKIKTNIDYETNIIISNLVRLKPQDKDNNAMILLEVKNIVFRGEW